MTWTTRRTFWVVLLLLGCVVYVPALSYGFVAYDDQDYVFQNRMVLQGLTWQNVRWAFEGQHIGHYHPLTWLSHQLDVSLFGLDARGHHATSLALHAASTLLLFLFLDRATGRTRRSGVVALLFALHPLHVEPVVWIASRKDVLSALFWMLSLVAYERYCQRRTVGRYLGVVLSYVAGLLSKPMVVTLPAILLLLDYWPLGRLGACAGAPAAGGASSVTCWRPFRTRLLEKTPLFALAGVSSWITTASAAEFGVLRAQLLPLGARIQNALVSYVIYLRELLLPVDLSIHHDRFFAAPEARELWLALAVLALISAVAVRCGRSHPDVLMGWLFYLVAFLPVIGLLQYGGHSIADRYAYIPSIGVFVMAVWGVAALLARLASRRWLAPSISGAVACVFGLLSVLQVRYWRSSEELFQHALEIQPDSPRLNNLLGVQLARRGALEEAEWHYRKALELYPAYTQPMNNLGVLLYRRGRVSEAIDLYERLLRIEPGDPKGLANLALALASQGRVNEAETRYRAAIRYDPDYLAARLGLVRLLAAVGRRHDAKQELEATIARFPHRRDLRQTLGALEGDAQRAGTPDTDEH